MVIGAKDSFKFFGIFVMACCAVTVCHLFLNFTLDLREVEPLLDSPVARIFYDAQLMTSKVVCALSGGCLIMTTVVLLFFYIRHLCESRRKELGILKALGYSNFRIARDFTVFGITVFVGCLTGYLLSLVLMPRFYAHQNEGDYLPEITIRLHIPLFFALVVLPAFCFGLLAVLYALRLLCRPTISLLKELSEKIKVHDFPAHRDFPHDMKTAVLRGRKTLVFLIWFGAFCFSAMLQMSAPMKDLSSEMMGVMIFLIGLALALTSLFIAISTVISANRKNAMMMRVFGYEASTVKRAVFDGYRPSAYLGFVLGTIYQYALLKLMVDVVFADVAEIPELSFDWGVCLLTLLAFVLIYEGSMTLSGRKIARLSVKEIMSE